MYLPKADTLQQYTLTVYIKNPDNRRKKLSLVAMHIDSGKLLHIAAADGTNQITLPVNSDFTCYVFDLSKVTDDDGNPIDRDWLSGISGFQFLFNDLASGSLYFDCIEMGFEAPAEAVRRLETEQVIAKISEYDLDKLNATTAAQLKETVASAKAAYEAMKKDFPDSYATNYELIALAEEALSRTIYGDVNMDGVINTVDALTVLQSVVGITELDERATKAADVNLDKKVDTEDALGILQYIVGQRNESPITD